jgi:hypothetical protein
LKRLVALLLEEDETDEYGVLQPSQAAFKVAMSEFEALSKDAIVYRSMLRKQWINEDTGKVKADAYFLRANEIGLSVNLECLKPDKPFA